LGAENIAAIHGAGGIILELLEQGTSGGTPPTTPEMDGWITTYGLKCDVLRLKFDNPPALEGREWAYLVDLSTMEIVWKAFGSTGTTNNSAAKQGLVEIKSRLGI